MTRPTGNPIIRTVLGDIDPLTAGPTAAHEHIIVEINRPLGREQPATRRALQDDEIRLDNYYEVRRQNTNHFDRRLDDVDVAVAEVRDFYAAGGRTIVEVTTRGLGRDPGALRRISALSDVHIVMGAGWYVQEFRPDLEQDLTLEQMTEEMVREVLHGVEDTGIRAGLIGEIGMSSPWSPRDEINLRASARAQVATGAALMIHPGRDAADLPRYFEVLDEENVDLSRVVISHVERTLFTTADLCELAARGAKLAFDLFGHEMSHYALSDIDMPNDARRVQLISELADAGHLDQVLISQDVYRKTALRRWGGEGYGHIMSRVLPLMRRRGFTETDIRTLVLDNPRDFFAFEPPASGM